MIAQLTAVLNAARPFITIVALLFGVLAAWLAMIELFPVLSQIARPRGTAQGHAIVGACLAIIGGRA
jgi:hypothetical protein